MINFSEVVLEYKLNWEKYEKLSISELVEITLNINKNMKEHINDEIKYYFECRE